MQALLTSPLERLAGTPDVVVAESAVDRTVDAGVRARLHSVADWRGLNNPWMPNDEEDVQYSYINLRQNPERYTGYQVRVVRMSASGRDTSSFWLACRTFTCRCLFQELWRAVETSACCVQGETATRIWEAIYSQSCFTNISDPDTCTERRVFYRLISGAHPGIRAAP